VKVLLNYLEKNVTLENDSKHEKAIKASLALISTLIFSAGILWSLMYLYLGYEKAYYTAIISTLFIGVNLFTFLKFKKFGMFLNLQLFFILMLPCCLQWSLGGFSKSGVVIIWAFLAPLGAVIFRGLKRSLPWLLAFGVLLLFSSIMNNYFENNIMQPVMTHELLFFTMNIGVVLIIFFLVLAYFFNQLDKASLSLAEKKNQLESLAGKLAKYLSPQVYASIFTGKQNVNIETYRRKLTVFFSDIVGFTDITDNLESESLTELLNDYLNEMAQISLKYGGTIDKFMGDAIMIFFGDPETRGIEEDAYACVSMAIEMREKMKHLRVKWNANGISEPLHIRMGINSGYCTVGNFGSDDRIDYTIVGGQVNLASRLESHAVSDQILISDETYLLIKDKIRCERMDTLQVKGINKPVQTYQILDKYLDVENTNADILHQRGPGYLISLDFDNITDDEKSSLRTILNKALHNISS